ncbi:MAG: mandelate racemase/muconate lactonizing enzyme family protein [Planctomycetes bacterium]|nr:mandelate racemase/muconate lactonizing enzyme family protein [Planctomycetota bacterium]
MAGGIAISDVAVFALRQSRDQTESVVIEVRTDAGVSGWGEAPAEPDLAWAVRAVERCKPSLIGRDVTATASIGLALDELRRNEGGRGPYLAGGAVNMALLDVLGKLSNAPAYQFLGGPTRNKARAIAALRGTEEPQLIESLSRCIQAGFRCVSIPLIQPAGVARGRLSDQSIRRLLERLREAGRQEVDFVLDCGGRLTPAEAASLARELESFHLLWLDEPCRRDQDHALAAVSSESATPIGWGRDIEDNSEFQDLLRMDAVDVLRPDVRRWGISPLRKAAALAETYYVAIAPHNAGGPIATAAALHVAASIPNFFLLEVPFPVDDADLAMRRELAGADLEAVQEGFLSLPSGPGLGVSVDRQALERYRVTL